MAEYICKCEKAHEESKSGVTIKFGDDGAYHDIKCPCGKYMDVKNPRVGVANLGRMNKQGSSY
jgi:hypothetical protein